jgi:predicted Co/Zn/Cd cation transporter (cation efflux family)
MTTDNRSTVPTALTIAFAVALLMYGVLFQHEAAVVASGLLSLAALLLIKLGVLNRRPDRRGRA